MTTEFPHLYPGAGRRAVLDAEERILRIRGDRWVSSPRAEVALAKLETLLAFPERTRMPNLLLVGESGMGKTMIIEKFSRDHPSSFDDTTGRLHMPVVAVQMVSGPDETRFYRRILAAIGAPVYRRLVLAYTLGGGIAGLAGALAAQVTQLVSLEVYSFNLSAEALIMLILGGTGRLYGAIIGTVIFMTVHHVAAAADPFNWLFLIGLMVLGVVFFLPKGLAHLPTALTRLVRGRT